MDPGNAELVCDYLSGKMGRLASFSAKRRAGTTTSVAMFATEHPMFYVHYVEGLRHDFLCKVREQAALKGYRTSEPVASLVDVVTEPDGTRHCFPARKAVIVSSLWKREIVQGLVVFIAKPDGTVHGVHATSDLPLAMVERLPYDAVYVEAWHKEPPMEVLERESERAVVIYFRP